MNRNLQTADVAVHSLAPLELMYRFESVGRNCEFGKVQSHWGATPPGLLKWARIAPTGLIEAINTGFESLADPGCVDFKLSRNREFHAINHKYRFRMHTFIHEDEVEPGELLDRFRERNHLLTRKFMEELDGATKIYVYAQGNTRRNFTPVARRIARALRRYGPNTLLWVTRAAPGDITGSVKIIGQGLLKGTIDHLGLDNISYDMWLTVCQKAYDLWMNEGRA